MVTKRYSKNDLCSYSQGIFPTVELLLYRPKNVIQIYIHPDGQNSKGAKKVIELSEKENIPWQVNKKIVEKLADKKNVYVIGIFKKYKTEIQTKQNHLILVEPQDMGNLGTIIRTMVGFGISNLILIGDCADLWNPKSVRASMGSLFQIQFAHFQTIEEYRSNFLHILYSFFTDGDHSISEVIFQQPAALIFGNEATGLPDSLKKISTTLNIPQTNRIDSLNLSVAVGIGLYEFHTQFFTRNTR